MLSNFLLVLSGAMLVAGVDSAFKCTKTGLYPRPMTNCQSYYMCTAENGTALEQTCNDGLLFHGNQKMCVPERVYICPDTVEAINPCHNETGRFPIPKSNCSSYYLCMKKGNSTIHTIYHCPNGSKFHPTNRRCEVAYDCSIQDGTHIPTTETTNNVTTTPLLTTIPTNATTNTTLNTTSAPSGTTQHNSTAKPPTTPSGGTTIQQNSTIASTMTQLPSPTPTIPEHTTVNNNNITSTELPQNTTSVNATPTPSPSGSSTVQPNITNTTLMERVVNEPSVPSKPTECPEKCIMCTETGHYRIVEDTTSYVSCIRTHTRDMLVCGINKCENGKVFCATSGRCINRI